MNSQAIAKGIKEVFGFLERELGCRLVKEEDDDFGVFVTYVSKKAGLRISYEPREGGVFVMIFPLSKGHIPPYKDWYDFADFLTAQEVVFEEPEIGSSHNPDLSEFRSVIEAHACEVRDQLPDYLAGDFAVTPQLEAIVNRRRDELRQQE